jgi:hypothetical protein
VAAAATAQGFDSALATENEQEPLNALRERFIAGLRYIAANPRQRALMQILYQRCEFASDMLSETKFANALVLIIPSLAASCSAVCVTIYCQPKQILSDINCFTQRLFRAD